MKITVDTEPSYYQNLGVGQLFTISNVDSKTILDIYFLVHHCSIKLDLGTYVTTTGKVVKLTGSLKILVNIQVYKVTVEE